jgi:molybdate transport system regulatory protein
MRNGPFKLKAQIMCGDAIAMGPGKADLLEAIAREGSISGAGRALGMSYRRTWLLVDEMNRCWEERLVETHKGGGAESGARVTLAGQHILDAYRAVEAAIEKSVRVHAASATLKKSLRDEPIPPGPQA